MFIFNLYSWNTSSLFLFPKNYCSKIDKQRYFLIVNIFSLRLYVLEQTEYYSRIIKFFNMSNNYFNTKFRY